jgi:hypothetical protein
MLFGTASFLSSIFRPKCRNQTSCFPRPCCGVHPDRRGRCQLWMMAALSKLQRGQPATGTVSVPACQRNTRDRAGLLVSESASERPTLLNSSGLPCHCLTHNRPELPLSGPARSSRPCVSRSTTDTRTDRLSHNHGAAVNRRCFTRDCARYACRQISIGVVTLVDPRHRARLLSLDCDQFVPAAVESLTSKNQ